MYRNGYRSAPHHDRQFYIQVAASTNIILVIIGCETYNVKTEKLTNLNSVTKWCKVSASTVWSYHEVMNSIVTMIQRVILFGWISNHNWQTTVQFQTVKNSNLNNKNIMSVKRQVKKSYCDIKQISMSNSLKLNWM